MTCHNCRIDCRKFGKPKNRQRYQCQQCRKVFDRRSQQQHGHSHRTHVDTSGDAMRSRRSCS